MMLQADGRVRTGPSVTIGISGGQRKEVLGLWTSVTERGILAQVLTEMQRQMG